MGVVIALALASGHGAARATPARDTGSPRATPARDVVALRAGARTILQKHCLPCHSGSADGAKPKALAVFDLDHVDWSKTLSDERLPKLLGRLAKGTPAERAQLQQFIDAELSTRSDAR